MDAKGVSESRMGVKDEEFWQLKGKKGRRIELVAYLSLKPLNRDNLSSF